MTKMTVAEYRKSQKGKPPRTTYRDRHLRAIRFMLDEIGIDHADEYRFHPTRLWKFDIALFTVKIAVEYEGVAGGRSRHTEIVGYTGDCEKYNEAQILGWIVLRFTAKNVKQAKDVIQLAINSRRND
jgi:very-short-patch-repair endonuclease